MKSFLKFIKIFTLSGCCLCFPQIAEANSDTQARYKIDDGRQIPAADFYASAILTTGMAIIPGVNLIGGLGHFVQGRSDQGLFFMATPLIAIGAALGGGVAGFAIDALSSAANGSNDGGATIVLATLGGIGTFLGLKVYEVVDIWCVPQRIASKSAEYRPTFKILPVYHNSLAANASSRWSDAALQFSIELPIQ